MKSAAKILTSITIALAFGGIASASEIVATADVVNVPTVIGGGLAMAPDYLGSDDYKVVPMPFAKYTFSNSQRYVKLSGLQFDFNVLNLPNFYAGPVLNIRGSRDENVKDDVVKKMLEIKSGAEVGAFVAYDAKEQNPRNKVSFNLKFLADASSEHDGRTVDFDISVWRQIAPRFDFFVGAGATYADEKYMDAMFGVNAANRGSATALELPDYAAESGMRDARVQVGSLWYYSKEWLFGGVVRYQRLLNSAKESPVVSLRGSEKQGVAAAFAAYLW